MGTHVCKDPSNCRHGDETIYDKRREIARREYEASLARIERTEQIAREKEAKQQEIKDLFPETDEFDVDGTITVRWGATSMRVYRKREADWIDRASNRHNYNGMVSEIASLEAIRSIRVSKKIKTLYTKDQA